MCQYFLTRDQKKINENLKFDNDKIFSVDEIFINIWISTIWCSFNGWFKKKLTFFHMAKRSNKLKNFLGWLTILWLEVNRVVYQ